jgi:alpha-L-fucosidase 2
MKNKIFIAVVTCIIIGGNSNAQNSNPLRIWYKQPAHVTKGIYELKDEKQEDQEWLKALPLGNGSLGAMVFGDVSMERIQLNEKTLWSGSVADNDNASAFDSLAQIRNLLFAGKYKEAEQLTNKTQVCSGYGTAGGRSANRPFGCYQTLGDLWIDFGTSLPYSQYHRELNLNEAIARINYTQAGVKFSREVFVNAPSNVIVIKITADKKHSINFTCSLTRPERFSTIAKDGQLIMSGAMSNGKGGDGMQYMARLQAKTIGGKQLFVDNILQIKNADEAILYITAATDYLPNYRVFKGNNFTAITQTNIQQTVSKKYEQLKEEHEKDYRNYFERVQLQLSNPSVPDTIPTDELLKRFKTHPSDNYLTQLYFQFGRYLLISSARENTLPANLQGIWANKIQTPWNADYHTNINVQMNYWPAELTNLSELHLSLAKYIKSLTVPGAKTASVQYHLPGWCVHTVANVWGFTSPGEHPSWGLSLGTLGWLCSHLWEHYLFTQDKQFLKDYYDVMKDAALFYNGWLVPNKEGKLVSGPASSPENSFITADNIEASMSMGPSHDQEVINELFTQVIAAADILGVSNSADIQKIKTSKEQLLLPKIGNDGRLLEWAEPFKETELGHRHLSHLYSFYPGSAYTQASTPEYTNAIRKSLEVRLANGGGYTGWSGAWVSNLWARFHDGDKAMVAINNVLKNNTALNLFDMHPPFQIDGNFGVTAGIAEMLLQSHQGFVELLPALPAAWRDGEVKGLCARGAFTIDMQWKNGRLIKARAVSKEGCKLQIRYADKSFSTKTKKGASYLFDENLKCTYL